MELEINLADSLLLGTYYRYSLGFSFDPSELPRIAYERVRKSGELILDRPDRNDIENPGRLAQTCLESASSADTSSASISTRKEIKEIAQFLESIGYLNFIPALFRHQDPFPSADMPSDPFGRKILQRVAKMPAPDREKRIRVIEDALKLAMPQMPKIRFAIDKSGSPCLEGTFDIGRPRAKYHQDLISDGTLAAFAILWSFLEGGSIQLLDMPEAYLNHETIFRISFLLYLESAFRREKQLIIGTHSEEFLKDKIIPISAKEIILLGAGSYKEGTKAILAASVPAIMDDMESGMTIDEAVMDYARGWDFMEELSEFLDSDIDFADNE